MLDSFPKRLPGLLAYDPGALRLVRGIHLMLTVLAAATLGNLLGALPIGVSGFKLAVLAAASGAHCLIFTPVATRRQEMVSLVTMAAVLVSVFGLGAVVGELAGPAAASVLQMLWVGVIALGFLLDGLGGVWQRAGRMMSICWLFVIMGSQPETPGIWLPVMALAGAVTAFVIRIGLWRPSTEATYRRVEAANRKAMAAFLLSAGRGGMTDRKMAREALSDLTDLRAELGSCAQLLGPGAGLRGLSPEAATMMELALDVVRDASFQLSEGARAGLAADRGFQRCVETVAAGLESGQVTQNTRPEMGWTSLAQALAAEDQFQVLRIAQALQRLWLLAAGDTLDPASRDAASDAEQPAWWHRLSWQLALQAGVAAAVGTGLGIALDLSHAYWVTLTVVIILANSLGTTLHKTMQRTIGTAVGVLIAMVVDPVLGGFPEIRLGLVIAAIPAVVVFMDRNYTIASGIISFLVVMGLQTLEGLPLVELWARLYDTLIGAGIGLGAAWLLFPKRSGDSIRAQMKAYLSACVRFLEDDGGSEAGDRHGLADLRRAAAQLVATADAYRAEQAPWSSFSGSGNKLDVLVIVLANYVVLYRQARTTVRSEIAGGIHGAGEFDELARRLDARVRDALTSVLEGSARQAGPSLAEEWRAAVAQVSGAEEQLKTDWVAMLYHARKVVRCLDGLHDDALWSEAFAPAPAAEPVR